ncbi:nucleoside hydrolase [Stackebrandtia nassauensis]|uniref:Inosine/uridine-preferring nucleoside hydrolase n=1 Tax=Stackebrandtia nassauensis (strain DSM 44728 / CIP 108903 / NRRL B-16338 / NBRC 102104 / LLR-40K-21) TaxID=446470 RepID=D3Q6W5_STANL|nr:nucleoside hydrolase [Stackebrandtia nassauensis]ADD40364.1 Inosine/uridine-preferring nucleoside hydrolase [Stackebrandtia nassauensis DSM 44728]
MAIDVVLDVDTGVDDALALLFATAHPALRVRAVTCVAGNVDVDQATRNSLAVLDAAGHPDIPVARGADRPLLRPFNGARAVHGDNGLGGIDVPDAKRSADSVHAVELLRRTIMDSPGEVTLIALAPLTNVALLLRMYPETAAALGNVMVMGGSVGAGNTTAAAEFNIWQDPEAAAIVLSSGVPLTMYGLDVFYQVTVDAAGVKRLLESSKPGASLAARLLEGRTGTWRHESRITEPEAACVGDAGAVCAVADPQGLTTRSLPVHVALGEGPTRGLTLVDVRGNPNSVPLSGDVGVGQVDVGVAVDGARYRRLFVETVAADD